MPCGAGGMHGTSTCGMSGAGGLVLLTAVCFLLFCVVCCLFVCCCFVTATRLDGLRCR